MKPLEPASRQLEWAAANFAYNLDFIPDDKLDWKPAPTASSVMEIIHHLLSMLRQTTTLIEGGQLDQQEVPRPATREEVKTQLIEAAQRCAQTLRQLSVEDLSRKVETPFGTFPLSFLATMPVTDTIHHHGQIVYIQTLLGDTESHFDMSLIPQ